MSWLSSVFHKATNFIGEFAGVARKGWDEWTGAGPAARESEKNRAFQERMRNTQWQATIADMEAAGLNPALAYSKGPNASPGGSMASQPGVGSGVSSALQLARAKKELSLLDRQIEASSASARYTLSQKLLSDWQRRMIEGFTSPDGKFHPGPVWDKAVEDAATAKSVARLRQLEIPQMKNIANVADSKLGELLTALRYILNSVRR